MESSRLCPITCTLFACLLGALSVPPARAQEDLWVPDVPMTRTTGTNARATGMGGAYLAISDDAGALRFNPAGLARVRRIEFSGGINDRRLEIETTDSGTRAQTEQTRTRVSSLGFVYPFPTYRGSMVIGFGYSVPYALDREYIRRGARGQATLEEAIYQEGSIGEWSFGYAVDVSPTMSLGFRATWLHGSFFQDWAFSNAIYEGSGAIHDVVDTDVNGYTASLGAMTRLGGWGRMGLVLDLPKWMTLSSSVSEDGGVTSTTYESDMTIPFSAAAGVAAWFQRLLLTADLRMTDWSQIDYAGPLRYWDDTGRHLAHRRTWDLHAGAEYLLDLGHTTGLRLRAGVAREPVPYGVVLEDIENGYVPDYAKADFDPDYLYFTAGAGILIEESLTVDAAYTTGSFTRQGGRLVEEEDERRLLLTAGFRLQ